MRPYQAILLALSVNAITRPTILGRMRHHTGPNRIHLDIALASQQITLLLDQAGAESSLPQRARTAISSIHILHIALPQSLHQHPHSITGSRRQQQMHMISHQHIGVDQAARLAGIFLQPIKIEAIILVGDEASLSVIATLDDVQGNIGESYAGAARHTLAPSLSRRQLNTKPWSVPYCSANTKPWSVP